MSASNYVYISDAGDSYQVTIPDDFAAALSMTAASGSEPYLDRIISPRYAVYRSALGITRTAIVQSRNTLVELASSVTVGGVTYNVIGSRGESIAAILNDLYSLPMGPAGERGPAGGGGGGGSLTSYLDELTTQHTFSNSNGGAELIFQRDLGAGTWLVMAQAIFSDSTSLNFVALTLAYIDYYSESFSTGLSLPSTLSQHISGLVTLASAGNITLYAHAYGTAPVLEVGGGAQGQGNQKGTHMICVKLA